MGVRIGGVERHRFRSASGWAVLWLLLFCRGADPWNVDAEGCSTVAGSQAAGRAPADNSTCIVCHQDFQDEAITANHRNAGIACTDCHGDSADHRSDELAVMLPDKMFGRKEIEPLCLQCHVRQDHPKGEPYQAFVVQWLGKYRPNGRIVRSNSICTDCHGNHAVLSVDQLR